MEDVKVNIDTLLGIYKNRLSDEMQNSIILQAQLEDMSRREFELREEIIHLKEDIKRLEQ